MGWAGAPLVPERHLARHPQRGVPSSQKALSQPPATADGGEGGGKWGGERRKGGGRRGEGVEGGRG